MGNYKKILIIIFLLLFTLILIKSSYTSAACTTDADCGSGYYCSGNLQNICTHKCLSGSCVDDCPTFCSNGCSNGACNAVLANTCSSSNPMYCYTQSECTGVGAQWCSTYCSTSCPSCSSTQLWNCYTESECTTAGGSWCKSTPTASNYYCQSGSCPTYVCSSSNPSYCTTQSECTGAGGYWCSTYCSYSTCPSSTAVCGNNICDSGETTGSCPSDCGSYTSPSYICSSSYPGYCTTKEQCTGAGLNWCGTYCQSYSCPTCSSSQYWNCYTESECKNSGAQWCGTYCSSSCPTCSSTQQWNCYSESACTGAGGNWCNNYCSSSTCPTCSSSQQWNCYSESTCKAASGYWCKSSPSSESYYCTSSSCPSYTCSSSSPWNCYTQSDCTNSGAQWCGTYCSSSCPTCSSSQQWNCYSESTCKAASGYWCNNYCQSWSCPTCSKDNPWNCFTQTDCTNAGGKWCDKYCSQSCPTCSKESPWNCYSKTDCTNAGANWCGTYCQTSSCPTCSKDNYWYCYNEADCKGIGASWCGTYCQSYSCPTCSKENPWNCNTETACTGAGGSWCTKPSSTQGSYDSYSYCQSGSCPSYVCSASSPWNCYTQETCKSAGAQWCNTYCSSSCPVCNKESPWNCYSQSECTSVSAQWCGTYCSSSCPTCSKENYWNCYTESDCKNVGASWCNNYCSNSCPTCSQSNPWNCYTESDCKTAGGYWCKSNYVSYQGAAQSSNYYCNSYSCPTCSKENLWNCYSQSDCTNAGGNWCNNYCSSYSCPSVCGNKICESSESKLTCSSDCGSTSNCPSQLSVEFNQNTFNVGDEAIMKVSVTDSSGNGVASKIEISSTKGQGSFSTFASTDNSGIYTFTTKISSYMPPGTYTFNVKTNAEGCNSVSSSASITVNSNGYCGDGTCSGGETSATCGKDCGGQVSTCPSNKQCPNGKTAKCYESPNGYCVCEACEFSPDNLPPGCTQQVDPTTGAVTVKCDHSCPPPPADISNMKQKCVDYGGTPEYKVDYKECNYLDCQFSNDKGFYNGYDRCFTEREIEEINAKCDKLGLPVQIKVAGECKVASCGHNYDDIFKCPAITGSQKSEIESSCSLQGLKAIHDFDANGCESLRCGTPDDCTKEVPKEAYEKCSSLDGEVVVSKDQDDCIIFFDCVTRGDERDSYIEDIKQIPSTTELLSIAFSLEEIRKIIADFALKSETLGEYYSSTGSNEQEKFERITSMLNAIIKKIDEIKDEIKGLVEQEEISKDDIIEIKHDISYINDVMLKDILYLMLSKSDEVKEIVESQESDCGYDNECFDRALRICKQVTFKPEREKGDRSTLVKINGLVDGKCVVHAELPEGEGPAAGVIPGVEPPYVMDCQLEDYALGIDNPEQDLFPYCTGSMADLIKLYQSEQSQEPITTGAVVAFLNDNRGIHNCVTELECAKVCDKNPFDCISYINGWIVMNGGPGGTRSLYDAQKYCKTTSKECNEWFLSRGYSLQDLSKIKKVIKGASITGYSIRR